METPSLNEYLEVEWEYLAEARRYRLDILGRFVDKPGSSIPGMARLTGTCLKSLYVLYAVLSKNPERVLSSPLGQLPSDVCDRGKPVVQA